MGQSRNEDILESMITGEEYSDVPKSREEYLLLQLKDVIEQGGGQGGTTNYNLLTNKPKINSVELSGDKSLSDIGVQEALNPAQLAAVNSSVTAEKVAQYDDIYAVMNYNTLNHNGIYRGKNLTGVYTIEQIYSMVHSGNFDDLFLGDYIKVSITTTLPDETVKTETVSLMIAAFDYYYNGGDTALATHHIVLIPRGYGFATTAKMNETNTITGGYLNSYMHQTLLPCYADSLRTALNNHLLSHETILSNAVNASTPSMAGAGMTGAASGWEWTTVELQLMNEVQVYGTTVWSSSAYDVGADNRQLPVFKFINFVHTSRTYFWLRSVVSSTAFAYCYYLGDANYGAASHAFYVRPLILFG
jgi:hypothetical protein